jgi:hypothetical protein
VPLVKQHTAVNSALDVSKLDVSVDSGLTQTHGLELLTQGFQERRGLRNKVNKTFHRGIVLHLVVCGAQAFEVVSKLVVFTSFCPLLSLSREVTEILVRTGEHGIAATAALVLLEQWNDTCPVTESHAQIESQIFPADVLEDLLCLVVPFKEAGNLSFLLHFLIKVVQFVNQLEPRVVFCLNKGSFGHSEV